MKNLILLILGLLLCAIGIANIMGNISTIHSYNRRRVKEEDVPRYGKVVGTGTVIIGAALVAAFAAMFWSELAGAVIVVVGLVVGLAFLLYGQFKYNGGIF